MNAQTRIVIVEDDAEIRSLVATYLRKQGLRVDTADGGAALDRLLSIYGEPDLIVLDIMLPGEDGLSICRRLRATSEVPVLMLTARGEEIDRIIGLELGADDYLPKPFNPRELLARIKAILRRRSPPAPTARRLRCAAFVVDLDGRSVRHEARGALELTSAEFDLLECFLLRPGRVLSRDQLMDWTRGRRAEALDRTIDVQMSRLRKKLEGSGEPIIKTIRNSGYVLAVPVEEA